MLNHLAGLTGNEYDFNGDLGRTGQVIRECSNLKILNTTFSHRQNRWVGVVREHIMPILNRYNAYPLTSQLRTAYEHISGRIAHDCNELKKTTMLATGGGARNAF